MPSENVGTSGTETTDEISEEQIPADETPSTKEIPTVSEEIISQPDEIIPDVPTEQIIDQEKLSAIEEKIAPIIEQEIEKYQKIGLNQERILEQMYDIKNIAKKVGISPEDLKGIVKPEGLQEFMDSLDGKIGGILSKLGISAEKFTNNLNKIFPVGENKIGQLLNKDVYELHRQAIEQQSGPLISFTTKLRELTGLSINDLKGRDVKDLIKFIPSSKIFGGTAEELIKKM